MYYYHALIVFCCMHISLSAQQIPAQLKHATENKELIKQYMHACATSYIDTPDEAYQKMREELLQRKLYPQDVAVEDEHGYTPLMYASEHNHYNLVVLFCGAGAEVITKDNAGQTALMKASAKSNIAVMNYLLQKNPKIVNQSDSLGWSALTYAVVRNACTAIAVLITAGANRNIEDRWDQKLIHLAKLQKTRAHLEKSLEELTEIAQRHSSSAMLNSPTRSPISATSIDEINLFEQTNSPLSQIYNIALNDDKQSIPAAQEMEQLQI